MSLIISLLETGESDDRGSDVLFYEKSDEHSNTAIVNPLKSTPLSSSFDCDSMESSAANTSTSKPVVNIL